MLNTASSIHESNASRVTPIIFRASIWNHIVLVGGIFLSIIATIYSTIMLPFTVLTVNLGADISFSIIAILPLILIAKLIHYEMDSRLVLLQEEVVYDEGLFAWRRHSLRIEYQHIREIEINQTLLQKLFNIGDIVIMVFASRGADRMSMNGIKDPNLAKDLIEARRLQVGHKDQPE